MGQPKAHTSLYSCSFASTQGEGMRCPFSLYYHIPSFCFFRLPFTDCSQISGWGRRSPSRPLTHLASGLPAPALVAAGLLVAVRPRIGAYVVAAWLAGIVLDLVASGRYLDVALRDLGLCLAALALGRLA